MDKICFGCADYAKLGIQEGGYVTIKSMNFLARPEPTVAPGSIAFNLIQRKTLSLGLNEPLAVSLWFPPPDNIHLTRMSAEVDSAVKKQAYQYRKRICNVSFGL